MSLTDASVLLARREISAVELAQACLERVEALDPQLNCFITITADLAVDQARRADEALRGGGWLGPLHGIPVTLKDVFETRGIRTTAGSKILSGYEPDADCAAYRKLRLAGAVLLGKTNMHEWAFGVTSQNPHFGPVRNPWDPGRVSGGSSGGSAAALAAGMCLGSLGSDTGGSIRIPASLCGVVGLKPTFGGVSLEGVIPLARSLDHAGPMGRTVEDVAVLYAVVADNQPTDGGRTQTGDGGLSGLANRIVGRQHTSFGQTNESAVSRPRSTVQFIPPRRPDVPAERLSGYTLALAADPYFQEADGQVTEAVRAAASAFETLGARVEEAAFPGASEALGANITLLLAEAAAYHAADLQSRPQDFGPDVLERLRRGAEIPPERVAAAHQAQNALHRRFVRFFDRYDLLLTPTTPEAAHPIELADPLQTAPQYTRFTAPFNLTGLPALSLPCGFTREGLPIGLQIAGPPGSEWRLLQAGHAFERQAGWFRRYPG